MVPGNRSRLSKSGKAGFLIWRQTDVGLKVSLGAAEHRARRHYHRTGLGAGLYPAPAGAHRMIIYMLDP